MVRCGGRFWLKPWVIWFAIWWRAVVVEWMGLKPCWCLLGLGIRMILANFHICGMILWSRARFNRSVRYWMASALGGGYLCDLGPLSYYLTIWISPLKLELRLCAWEWLVKILCVCQFSFWRFSSYVLQCLQIVCWKWRLSDEGWSLICFRR